MKKEFPYDHHGVTGGITVKMHENETLNTFCKKHIKGYDLARYEAIALRVYAGKEVLITVYAIDRQRQKTPGEKLQVKKFRLENIPVTRLLDYFEMFNFTISPSSYNVEEMEVIGEEKSALADR